MNRFRLPAIALGICLAVSGCSSVLTATRDDPIPAERIRVLPRIGGDQPLRDALAEMQGSGAHLGAATGPGGEVIGVVTLEDMLEELVGQIRDDSRAYA